MQRKKPWNKLVDTGLMHDLQRRMVGSDPIKASQVMLNVLVYAESLFCSESDIVGVMLVREARAVWRACTAGGDREFLALAFKEIGQSLENMGYAEPAIACYMAHLTVKHRPTSFWLTSRKLPGVVRTKDFDDMVRNRFGMRQHSIAA